MKRFLAILAVLFTAASPLFLLPAAAAGPASSLAAPNCPAFTRNLSLGANGAEVRSLQQFLNSKGYTVASAGPGSPGQESIYFGAGTRRALARFQAAEKIYPASGYFGALTRAKITLDCLTARLQDLQTQSKLAAGAGSANSATIPVPALPPASGTEITPPAATTTPADAVIPPQSVVGVLCTYRNGNQIQLMKGSGVIVDAAGDVLTARHLVDPAWTLSTYASTLTPDQQNMYQNVVLDHCDIGLPESASLPSAADIQTYNPSELITRNFQYRADITYLPSRNGLSDMEYQIADFAVLKIASVNLDCPFFNQNCTLGNFAHAAISPVLPDKDSAQVLSYGYPAEAGLNQDAAGFYDFYLKGAVGTVGAYLTGSQMFAGEPLNFSFESSDIQGGRSGSPVFYKGRLMGILYGSTSTRESYNLSITAIEKILANAGLGSILAN